MTAKPKKTPKPKPKPHRATGRRPGPPSVWAGVDKDGKNLEARIIATLIETGCSFKDAAELHGITHETLKARQRTDGEFSARLAHARLSVKTRTLGFVHTAAAAGNVRAMTFYLERVYRDEYGARFYDDGSAAAIAAAQAAADAEFRDDVEFGRRLAGDPEALAAIGRISRSAADGSSASPARAGVPRASGQPAVSARATPRAPQPPSPRRRGKANS